MFPKIELHVHLEGTVRPATLLEIARRNDYALPADTVEGLAALYEFRDFEHFVDVWILTTNALQSEADFRQVVVDYAAEAAAHGAVYVEGIFSPAERVRRGVSWDEVYSGYRDGAQEARELHGVEVALTPDIPRGFTLEEARQTVRYAVRYGLAGVGLGGLEAQFPPEPYADVFHEARAEGLASVPHAGEVAGPASVWGALEALQADRVRHGIRAVEDPTLVRELAAREIVLDVCPISNLRTGAVVSLEEHPLPKLVEAGVLCSLSTDEPALFDTDPTPVAEQTMFFMRLRRSTKPVFIFLALVFALSFVFLGVGSGSSGIGDLLQGNFDLFGGSSSTSVSGAQKRIQKTPRDAAAYRDLARAYQVKGDTAKAIDALKTYTRLRPKDTTALTELAGTYLSQADAARQQAIAAQSALTTASLFTPVPVGGKLGTALGQNPITEASTSGAQTAFTTAFQKMQTAYSAAVGAYKRVAKRTPNDPTVQLQLASTAESANDAKTAIAAYKRFLKLAPDDPSAPQVKQRIKALQASLKPTPKPTPKAKPTS